MGSWIQEPYYLNYVWSSLINGTKKKQQAALEKTLACPWLGNYESRYDVVSSLDHMRFLNNFYFDLEIAKKDVEGWAEIVESSLGMDFRGIHMNHLDAEIIVKPKLQTILVETKLVFCEAEFIVYRFCPVRLGLERPAYKYYTAHRYASEETASWINYHKEKIDETTL